MQYLKRIVLLGAFALVTACGGGGSGGSNATATGQTGNVTLSVSDASVDGYSQIIMTIREIRFLSDSGQDVLVLDQPREVDFLSLSNFSEVLLKRDVVAGTYSKIRLILDSLVLVPTDTTQPNVNVALNGLQKIDINPQGPFTIRGGQYIVVNVDLDLDRSIHIVQAGNSNRVNFRPVIFATISTVDAFDKLLRVEGRVESIDSGAGTLNVCDIRHVSDSGSTSPNPKDVCVFTQPNGDTSYFDQESMPLDTGLAGLAVNDQVVMYGKFDPAATNDTFIPAVIAMGSQDTFARERGIVTDIPDPGTLQVGGGTSDVCPSAASTDRIVEVAAETAVFLEDANGDSTRATRSDIQACRRTESEGTAVSDPSLTPSDFLRSFIVLQNAAPVAPEEELVGTLAAGDGTTCKTDEYTLTPSDMSADQCVSVNANTHLVEIDNTVDPVTTTVLSDVPTGVEVTVDGVRNDADTIVANTIIHEITASP
jgi:hypothetical protein